MKLQALNTQFVDGENKAMYYDVAYAVTQNSLLETIAAIRAQHGADIYLLPISAASGGSGVFQVDKPGAGTVVGLQIVPSAQPRVSQHGNVDITQLALDEVVIDASEGRVYAGAAITLDQLNRALAHELGPRYKVLGADLTSYTYAQVGATFMTGGMGPQRRYFSDSVDQISLYDGEGLQSIAGQVLGAYAGTYGWSGLVTAVRCSYHQMPVNEIAFTLPVNSAARDISRLLTQLSPFTRIALAQQQVLSQSGTSNLILGIEHITSASMGPMLALGETALTRRARQLAQKCEAADADGLVFVNGYSDLPVDEFLFELVDDADAEEFTIAGIRLEHAEIFTDPELMRALREAVPAAARSQIPQGKYLYKAHTDIDIAINPDNMEQTISHYWQINLDYVQAVQDYFESTPAIRGEILVYGHLNPVGIDPHNRITFACDEQQLLKQGSHALEQLRDQFTRQLHQLCEQSGSAFIGGEKGAGSESEIFEAFGGPQEAPQALREKYQRQVKVIQTAAPMFNWRAMPAYRAG